VDVVDYHPRGRPAPVIVGVVVIVVVWVVMTVVWAVSVVSIVVEVVIIFGGSFLLVPVEGLIII
jgi:hypothetical protein